MNKSVRGAVVVAVTLMSVASVSACGSSSGGGSASGSKTVYLVSSVGTGWQAGYNSAFMNTLKDKGLTVEYLQDPFDVNKNVSNLDQAIASRPAAVAFMALSTTAVLPSLERAKKLKVPVVSLDGRPDPRAVGLLASSLEADNYALGKFAAQNIVEGLQKQGRKSGNIIALTGTAATNTVQDRMKGFKEVLAATPQYELVATEDANWDQTKTAQLAQQLFAKYKSQGGIAGAYGMADNQAAGIIQAAKQAGVDIGGTNGLIVTGSNCYKSGIDAIKADTQYGTATQAPGTEGVWAAEYVAKLVDGQKIPEQALNQEARVTPDNVNQYAAECSSA